MAELIANVPIFDAIADQIKLGKRFEQNLTQEDLEGIMRGVVGSLLAKYKMKNIVAKLANLHVGFAEQKGSLNGAIQIVSPIPATIGIDCVLANDDKPGRIKLETLAVREGANIAETLLLAPFGVTGQIEQVLGNPTGALKESLAGQLTPRGVKLTGTSFHFAETTMPVIIAGEAI